MASIPPSDRSFAREGDLCLCLGRSRHRGTGYLRRSGEIWVVLHREGGKWTHVYRLDERDGRTAHLENFAPGDARSALIDWALATFEIEAGIVTFEKAA